jgi:hypothetical protein
MPRPMLPSINWTCALVSLPCKGNTHVAATGVIRLDELDIIVLVLRTLNAMHESIGTLSTSSSIANAMPSKPT